MQFGVIVNNLGISQRSHSIIKQLNKFLNDPDNVSPSVFYQTYDLAPMDCKFGLFQDINMLYFNWPLISIDIQSTQRLINCRGTRKKFFYVWDFEWINSNKSNRELTQVYNNDAIELIARTPHHFSLLEKLWKKPLTIIEDFNHEEIKNTIFS